MQRQTGSKTGIKRLIQYHKRNFEIDENKNYYSDEDFVLAQRKYIKFVLGNALTATSDKSD